VRIVSVGRGRDPRDFAFFAFGGAGPLHATTIAGALGIPKVLVAARPGMTNALGCVVADLRRDFVRTVNAPLDELEEGVIANILEDCADRGRELVYAEKADIERIDDVFTAGIQFKGQTHELDVPVTSPSMTTKELRAAFDEAYWRRFRMSMPGARAILVKLHTAVIGRRSRLDLKVFGKSFNISVGDTTPATRRVWFESGWREATIYQRDWLSPEMRIAGPAIVEQLDTTIVIEPGQQVRVDEFCNLIIDVRVS
jgi:N-methylhydantoinase A